RELQQELQNAKVDKIYQPSAEELVFLLRRKQGGGAKLLLSARANSPRICFTSAAFENPATPPMLCMLLRKRLGGATLTEIRQENLDRVLALGFEATNEMGEREKLTLMVEIMAQYSNVILVDANGTVIDALKRVDISKSSKRQVLPGLPYQLPPKQDKLSLQTDGIDAIMVRLRQYAGKTLSGALLSTLMGMSPVVARELAFRSTGEDPYLSTLNISRFSAVEIALLELRDLLEKEKQAFCVVKTESGKPFEFSFFPLTQYGTFVSSSFYDSPSALLEDYYGKRDSMERMASKTADLTHFLTKGKARIARKMEAQKGELARCKDRETLRISAELIQANLHRLQKGVPFFDLENYYEDGALMRIPVNPAYSPAQNAQKYYKEYRKTYTAEKKLKEQLLAGAEELRYLDTVLDALSRAEKEADIAAIKRELIAGGYLKEQRKQSGSGKRKKGQKQPAALPPLEYRTTDGYTVLVGRNNLQNDKLSLKQAGKLDYWFHSKDFPGSHVILCNQNGTVSEQAILEAACIAAVNSTAASSTKAEVDYTLVKNLKKPAG
ncbi:MAG TPA: NFACT RNA binding domain-containing protein, partial [Clostridiales bacterium]|nr:NFACT RNA binding domain-containing protein [Clostridiales bacterium]